MSKEPTSSEAFRDKKDRLRASGSSITPGLVVLQEDVPCICDVEEFQYRYKCKHCGHEWSEVHETERRVSEPKGYTGD